MKKIFLTIALAMGLGFSSCNYLDVVPEGSATMDDLYKTYKAANNFAASLYTYMPSRWDMQSSIDFCSDDMISGCYGSVYYFKWKSNVYNNYESASTTYFKFWSTASTTGGGSSSTSANIWAGVRNCYNMINNADRVGDATVEQKNQWKGEAYYLIGYYHQCILEYYGPTVIIDHELGVNEDMNFERRPYMECVQFISDMYDKAAELLPTMYDSDYYGRATKTLAKAMKSRLWTYAASPLINGNSEFYSDFKNADGTYLIPQTEDKELWKTAMDAAEAAIKEGEADGFGLYAPAGMTPSFDQGYKNMRQAFIGTGDEGGSSFYNYTEHLFSKLNTSNYQMKNFAPRYGMNNGNKYNNQGFRGYFVPTLESVENFLSVNGLPMNVDPTTKDIDLYSLDDKGETVMLHHNREPRFYAYVGYDRGEYNIQGKKIILKCRRGEEQQNDGDVMKGNEYQTATGYYIAKWVCQNDSYNVSGNSFTFTKFAYPYIRMAEPYLDYAEADAMYDGQISDTGLKYLNKVRNRAGLPNFETAWKTLVGRMPTGDELINAIRQERMSEFAYESRWYHDLRRWKLAGEAMQSSYGWNLAGETAEDFYKRTPIEEGAQVRTFKTPRNYWLAIPNDQININPKLVQNPGY